MMETRQGLDTPAKFQCVGDGVRTLPEKKNKWWARLRFPCGSISLSEPGLMGRSLSVFQEQQEIAAGLVFRQPHSMGSSHTALVTSVVIM